MKSVMVNVSVWLYAGGGGSVVDDVSKSPDTLYPLIPGFVHTIDICPYSQHFLFSQNNPAYHQVSPHLTYISYIKADMKANSKPHLFRSGVEDH